MGDNPSTAAVPAEAPAPRPAAGGARAPDAGGAVALRQLRRAPLAPGQALEQQIRRTLAIAMRYHLAGRVREAREMAERAIASSPDDAMAHFSLGACLRQLRRDKEAVAAYEKAIALDPGMTKAWINLAVSTERLDRERSLAALATVLEREPENLVALNMAMKFNLQDCDFEACEARLAQILRIVNRELAGIAEWRVLANIAYRALFVPVPPPLLRRITDRIDQLHLRSLAELGPLPPLPPPDAAAAGRRIRVGYMTPNFADHPVGHVTLQLSPAHDRERFEVHAIATQGRRGGDADYNRRHRHGVDYYHDLSGLPHREMARRIRNLGIDILVDLDGYMETVSTAVMVFRPSPVQVYWMGHAGGLGLSFVDYLIADSLVVPPGRAPRHRSRPPRLQPTAARQGGALRPAPAYRPVPRYPHAERLDHGARCPLGGRADPDGEGRPILQPHLRQHAALDRAWRHGHARYRELCRAGGRPRPRSRRARRPARAARRQSRDHAAVPDRAFRAPSGAGVSRDVGAPLPGRGARVLRPPRAPGRYGEIGRA